MCWTHGYSFIQLEILLCGTVGIRLIDIFYARTLSAGIILRCDSQHYFRKVFATTRFNGTATAYCIYQLSNLF